MRIGRVFGHALRCPDSPSPCIHLRIKRKNRRKGYEKDWQPHCWADRPGTGTFQHTENRL
eukprot:1146199-Pelagomonas_calceolata.AAC.9